MRDLRRRNTEPEKEKEEGEKERDVLLRSLEQLRAQLVQTQVSHSISPMSTLPHSHPMSTPPHSHYMSPMSTPPHSHSISPMSTVSLVVVWC